MVEPSGSVLVTLLITVVVSLDSGSARCVTAAGTVAPLGAAEVGADAPPIGLTAMIILQRSDRPHLYRYWGEKCQGAATATIRPIMPHEATVTTALAGRKLRLPSP